VEKENTDIIKSEIDEYQQSKNLYLRWVELSIQASKLRFKTDRTSHSQAKLELF